MTSTRLTRGALIAATVALAVTGCSSSDSGSDTAAGSSTAATSSAPPADTGPVGPGCAQLEADPAGSLTTMATQPVGTAAAANPLLTTLASVIGTANLTAALDAQTDITVLAPANAAFDAIPADQVNALVADLPRLTSVLQHHVLSGRLTPDQLVGEHTTLLGDTVTVTGSAEAPVVSADQTVLGTADATLVCGDVQTANATVYILDQVLSPEA